MKSLLLFSVVCLSLLAPDVAAQYPIGAAGFQFTSASGNVAGTFCFGFSCTPAAISVLPGEFVTLRVSGEFGVPYAIFTSLSATQCQSFPGVFNALVLDQPIFLLTMGTLSQVIPILSCPPGFQTLSGSLPPSFVSGTFFALQAVTLGAGFVPSFTQSIAVTVL